MSAALAGGGWVRRGAIRVWQPTPPAPPPPPPVDDRPVVCQTCDARLDEACRTPKGKATHPHAARTRPRSCACGTPFPGHGRKFAGVRYCEPCRVEARRASWRKSTRRRTAARKAAA